MKKNDTEQIRAANRADIIVALRVYGPIARVELGRLTRLSPATVTAITAELAEEGVILTRESQETPQGRGRPRVMIDLNPDHGCVLGLKILINEVRLMLGDLKGHIVAEEVVKVKTQALDEDELNAELVQHANRFINAHPGFRERLVSLGIAVQGFVDTHQGSVVWSPAMHLRQANLTDALAAHFQCPVELVNDANCIAYQILRQPQYAEIKNFAVVMIGYGVGGGLIVNGQVYSGHFGAAAEFGHTKYSHDGPQCACGKRGCIEAYIADYALYRDASAVMELAATDRRHPSEKQMLKLTNMARDGDPYLSGLFSQAGRVLGLGIANLMALMSPERVVVTGPGIRAYDLMAAGVQTGIEDALVPELVGRTAVEALPWSEDMTGQGIIALALRHFR